MRTTMQNNFQKKKKLFFCWKIFQLFDILATSAGITQFNKCTPNKINFVVVSNMAFMRRKKCVFSMKVQSNTNNLHKNS